jgi:hypothetical protein
VLMLRSAGVNRSSTIGVLVRTEAYVSPVASVRFTAPRCRPGLAARYLHYRSVPHNAQRRDDRNPVSAALMSAADSTAAYRMVPSSSCWSGRASGLRVTGE